MLVVTAEPSNIPKPGFLRKPGLNISWIADNQLKGISPVPALTIHATADFSLRNWSADRKATGEKLLEEARHHVKMNIIDFQVHAWKYAKPQQINELRSLVISTDPFLLLAGDAFGGPRVEGAALSGWDAARKLEDHLGRKSRAGY